MSAVLQQQTLVGLTFRVRPTLRLYDVQEYMAKTRAVGGKPSRHTLIAMVESGELEGKLTRFGWVVFEDSLLKWLGELNQPA